MIIHLSKVKWILLVTAFLVMLIITLFLYYYINTNEKTTKSFSINVNKLEEVNKAFTYNVYSDFYYRATKYNDEGERIAMFSEVIPVETKIGFNFADNKVLLNSTAKDPEILIDNNGSEIYLIDAMRAFAPTFGEIFTTQDQGYFNAATKSFKDLYFSLYNQEVMVDIPQTYDYYEGVLSLAVDNLKLNSFRLKEINSNLKSFKITPPGEWSPNLIEYKFGENDVIHLQYTNKTDNDKEENNFIADKEEKSFMNKIVFDTVKVNNNNLKKLRFVLESNSTGAIQNLITSYYQDDNGYNYLLRFYPKNEKSFKKYLPDFLKLAYSLYFIDLKDFKNDFAEKQRIVEENYSKYLDVVNSKKKEYTELRKYLVSKGYAEHFSLPEANIQTLEYKPKKGNWWWDFNNNSNLVSFDKALNHYYDIYGEYPLNRNGINYFESLINDYNLVKEASEQSLNKYGNKIGLLGKLSVDTADIKIICNDIDCIKKLKNNGW